jgi:hypothetical protein
MVLLLPHIIKLFRSSPKAETTEHGEHHEHSSPGPIISAEMPWLLTQVINTERNTQEILHMLRAADGQSRLDILGRQVTAIEKMLRRRSGRSKKLSPLPGKEVADDE